MNKSAGGQKMKVGVPHIVAGIIFIVAGIALAVYVYQQGQAFMRTAVETTATITEIKRVAAGSSSKKTRMAAFVSFQTESGSTQTARLDYYVITMNVGDTVEIKYDPAKPFVIMTGGPSRKSLLVGGVAVLFGLLIGIAGVIGVKRKS